jgi:hypothetical protein
MYIHVHAPAMQATAPTVFIVWLLACLKRTLTLQNLHSLALYVYVRTVRFHTKPQYLPNVECFVFKTDRQCVYSEVGNESLNTI